MGNERVKLGEETRFGTVHHPRASHRFPCGSCLSVQHVTKDCKTTEKEAALQKYTRIVTLDVNKHAEACIASKMKSKKEVTATLATLRKLWAPEVLERHAKEAAEEAEHKRQRDEAIKKEKEATSAKEKALAAEERKHWTQTSIQRRAMRDLVKMHFATMNANKKKQYLELHRVIAAQARLIKTRAQEAKRAASKQTTDSSRKAQAPASTQETVTTTEDQVPEPMIDASNKPTDGSQIEASSQNAESSEMDTGDAPEQPPPQQPGPPPPPHQKLTLTIDTAAPIVCKPVQERADTPRPPSNFAMGMAPDTAAQSTAAGGPGRRPSVRASRPPTPKTPGNAGNRQSKTPTRKTPKNAARTPMPYIKLSTVFGQQGTSADDMKTPGRVGDAGAVSTMSAPESKHHADHDQAEGQNQGHVPVTSETREELLDAVMLSPRKRSRPAKSPRRPPQDGDEEMKESSRPPDTTRNKKRTQHKTPTRGSDSGSDSDEFEPAHLQPSFELLRKQQNQQNQQKQLVPPTKILERDSNVPRVQASVTEFLVDPSVASASASQDSSQDCVILSDRPEHWPAEKEKCFVSKIPIFSDGPTAAANSPTSSPADNQEDAPLIASPFDFGPSIQSLEDWKARYGARVIGNSGGGRCLQRAMDAATRSFLAETITAIATGKEPSREANHYTQKGGKLLIKYLPQMIEDGTVQARPLYKRFLKKDAPLLTEDEVYEAILAHVWETLSYPIAKDIPKDRWSGAEEVMGLVWLVRQPIFVIGANNHVQVYIIEQAPATSKYEEKMLILALEDADAWAMIQTILNHKAIPIVLVHEGAELTGHWTTFRFPEAMYTAWCDKTGLKAGDERMKDRLDLALLRLGLYVAVSRDAVPDVKRSDATDFPSQASGSVYSQSSEDSQDSQDSISPTPTQISALTLDTAESERLHAALNGKLRLRSTVQDLWRTAERANLREVRNRDAPGFLAADAQASVEAMTNSIERRVANPEDVVDLLRRLPFPLVAIEPRPEALVSRLGRALLTIGGGLRYFAWMSNLQSQDPDRIDALTSGTNTARCTLQKPEEALFLKLAVVAVISAPATLPPSQACVLAHGWIYSNAADARQLLVEMKRHHWSNLLTLGDRLRQLRDAPQPTADAAEAAR